MVKLVEIQTDPSALENWIYIGPAKKNGIHNPLSTPGGRHEVYAKDEESLLAVVDPNYGSGVGYPRPQAGTFYARYCYGSTLVHPSGPITVEEWRGRLDAWQRAVLLDSTGRIYLLDQADIQEALERTRAGRESKQAYRELWPEMAGEE